VIERVDVLHGVNLDQLGHRDPLIYGDFSLSDLEIQVKGYARELDLHFELSFFQSNFEGEFCEALHLARERADGLLVNAGAWSHYSCAIRDALEVSQLPAVEVHLSDIENREPWRRHSVIRDVCIGHVQGKGPEGYRDALSMLHEALNP
jgi:3-dehydroquinate dehydratase II